MFEMPSAAMRELWRASESHSTCARSCTASTAARAPAASTLSARPWTQTISRSATFDVHVSSGLRVASGLKNNTADACRWCLWSA